MQQEDTSRGGLQVTVVLTEDGTRPVEDAVVGGFPIQENRPYRGGGKNRFFRSDAGSGA